MAGEHSEIDMIPYKAEQIGCENGILWNELEKGPQGCLDPLLKLLTQGVKQCVDDYRSTYVEVFLYFIQIAVSVQKYLLAVIEANGAAVHNDYNRRLSSYLNDDCQSVLRRLLGEAIDADDKDNMVILYAHVLIAGGNLHDPARKLNPRLWVTLLARVLSLNPGTKMARALETMRRLVDYVMISYFGLFKLQGGKFSSGIVLPIVQSSRKCSNWLLALQLVIQILNGRIVMQIMP